jgi:uncharacterized repeat protein (TIGR03803 family)
LYGAAESGGSSVRGTVFAGNTNGSGFTVLHNFVGSDGAGPLGQLILSGKTLYGTTYAGGSSPDGAFNGTVFSLALPQLAIIRSGAGVILTWPTNAAGFVLQSASNLVSPADWTAVSPGPVVLNGRNTVTNSLASGTRFFRLFHP